MVGHIIPREEVVVCYPKGLSNSPTHSHGVTDWPPLMVPGVVTVFGTFAHSPILLLLLLFIYLFIFILFLRILHTFWGDHKSELLIFKTRAMFGFPRLIPNFWVDHTCSKLFSNFL
jgi:hypothetical protein